jgi:CheY-like chemotaxis protein
MDMHMPRMNGIEATEATEAMRDFENSQQRTGAQRYWPSQRMTAITINAEVCKRDVMHI